MNNAALPLLLIGCLMNSSCGCGGPGYWGQDCGINSCGWGRAPCDWGRGCNPCGGFGGCGDGAWGCRTSCYFRPHCGCGWWGW